MNLNYSLYPGQEILATGGLIYHDILNVRFQEIIFISVYFFLFLLIVKLFIKNEKINIHKSFFIIAYHFSFTMLAYLYSITNVNDIDSHFQYSFFFGEDIKEANFANSTIIRIYYFLTYFLNLHYFSTFIFFSFFSSFGYLLLFKSFSDLTKKFAINENLILLILLFPSWHFFTSFPGKDSIFIFSLGLFFFFSIKKKYFFFIIPFILIMAIRPHMVLLISGVLILLFLKITFLEYKKKKNKYIFFNSIVIFAATYFTYNYICLHCSTFILEFNSKGEVFRQYGQIFSTWYDTYGDTRLELFYKYLFYPIFNINSPLYLMLSIENIIIMLLILKAILNFKNYNMRDFFSKNEILFCFIYFTLGVFLLSNYTANIGISTRQKWMLLPSLLIIILPLINKSLIKK